MVVRKVCASLVAYYLRPEGKWKQSIRHLILCLHEGVVVPNDLLERLPATTSVIGRLEVPHMLAVLWFAGGLVEEVSKTNIGGIQTYVLPAFRHKNGICQGQSAFVCA